MSDDSQVKQAKPLKYKTIAVASPILPSQTFAVSGPYSAADLGKLLYKRACEEDHGAHPGPNTVLTLTRDKDLQYFRGLKDAHMQGSSQIYDMLCLTKNVEVKFTEVPEDRN